MNKTFNQQIHMNNVDTIDTKNENNELRASIIDTMDYYEIKFAAICFLRMNARSKTFFFSFFSITANKKRFFSC